VLVGCTVLLGVLVAPTTVLAQSAPSSIMGLISSATVSPTDEQRIERYVTWYADQVAASGPDAASATTRLLEPLKSNAASRSFRGAYSRIAVDRMKRIAADPASPYAATSAMVVLTKIGTPAALSALVDEADSRRQSSWWVRLAAARGVRTLLKDDFNDAIDDRGRLRCSRDMAGHAERETDPRVLRYVLLSILEADDERLEPGTRGDIHENLANAMTTVATRARNDASLAAATGLAVATARNAFLEMANTREVQLNFSRLLAPAMIEILAAYEAQWPTDASTASPAILRDIERIEIALGFLVIANNPSAAVPTPPAATAWTAGNRDEFSSAVGAWRAALR
jgi:hypothetical protein